MGMDKEMARLARNRFREHNLATLDAMFPHFRDEVKTISIAQTARDALANSFEQDGIRVGEGKETD
jgi:glutathione-regulated potassium-efflux system ancillary protein KefC